MSRLIESIRLYKGEFSNLPYHEERMNRAARELHWGMKFDLEELVHELPLPLDGLYKYRLVYDNKMHKAEFTPYMAKTVNSLKLVSGDDVEYQHKFEDRSSLDRCFGNRGTCDDVLMIRAGMVTDTSYANIAFKKEDKWFTPSTYLLNGTMRQSLLDKNVILEIEIQAREISQFESFKLINSMLAFEGPEISVKNIMQP